MKKLLLLALAACLPFSAAFAQGYEIWYGNTDGSPIIVGADKDIQIPCWVATDGTNMTDSLGFMHNPLASDDAIISARTGGIKVAPFTTWDDVTFRPPDADAGGFTNQSMLAFCETGGDPPDAVPVNTAGLPILASYYKMHTAPGVVPDLVNPYCPFQEGDETVNHTHLWGNQNGTVQWIPAQNYGCLIFSPNTAPVFDPVGPLAGIEGVPVCFTVSATDNDDNDQTVTITGPGGFTIVGATGADFASGSYCAYLPFGTNTIHFEATDGSDIGVLDVVVEVAANALDIQGNVGACVFGMPGSTADVNVTLHTDSFLCGGFELLIQWDPTALTYTGVDWLPRINGGSEYHNIIPNVDGPGTAKFVWIADVNNGIHTEPAAADLDAAFTNSFLTLHFNVASGLPFGMLIPVTFDYTGDFRDNTISDSTGYVFSTPPHSDGCVEIFDYTGLQGDPNMNCLFYEVADVVLVAQRLIQGLVVWTYDDLDPASPTCTDVPFDRHDATFNGAQEAAADLNDNGFADVGDLVWFINILNGISFPPKLDPVSGSVGITMNNGVATINSGVEVGAALVRVEGQITPVANGMDMQYEYANGMTSVLVYSLSSNRIAAGSATLFTYTGEGSLVEVSAADIYGRLLDASARPALPTQFAVSQNYPNPFNAKTLISFDLPNNSDVTISIYNIAGQLVQSIKGNYAAGHQAVSWDASSVSSGVYFAKVSTGDNTQTIKMTMLK